MIQIRAYHYFFLAFLILLTNCGSSKKQAQIFEELPLWVKIKPQNTLMYYGIGKAPKRGFPDAYIKSAEQNALADLGEQISVKVNTASLLYQFEIDNQKSDFYMNKQKIKSSNFFEGHTITKTYENEKFYWTLVEISKNTYKKTKQERKDKSLKKAYEYYSAGKDKKDASDFYAAASFFIKSLEALKPYWSEDTNYKENSGNSVDLAIESINQFHSLFKNLTLKNKIASIQVKRGEVLNDKTPLAFLNHTKYGKLNSFPYKIHSSFSYEKSEQRFTKDKGTITPPRLKVGTLNRTATIKIVIDGKNVLKQMTTDLILRKIVTNSIPDPLIYSIDIVITQPFINIQFSSPKRELDLKNSKLTTVNFFEEKGIKSSLKSTTNTYQLFLEILPIAKESFKINVKLESPSKEEIYTTSRNIVIDTFVYNTEEKKLQSILNSLKRKEFSKILKLINQS